MIIVSKGGVKSDFQQLLDKATDFIKLSLRHKDHRGGVGGGPEWEPERAGGGGGAMDL